MIRIGTDIEEIERIQRAAKNPRFLTRVFLAEEMELFRLRKMSAATMTGNFCAKEAFAKAVGTGIRDFSLNEVSVLRDGLGAPLLQLTGRAQMLAERLGLSFSVSISHCPHYATAVVIAYEEEKA